MVKENGSIKILRRNNAVVHVSIGHCVVLNSPELKGKLAIKDRISFGCLLYDQRNVGANA